MNETLKQEISTQLGIATDRIGQVKLELSILRRQGLLIDLEISGVSMFVRTATYLEMGWGDADQDARRVKMGRAQKYLIPEERIKQLRSVETRMRQLLEKISYTITGFAPYRWLPVTAYARFRSDWTGLTDEFQGIKDDIIDNLDEYRSALADEMLDVAESAWKSITSVSHDKYFEWAIIDHKPYDHPSFIALVMTNALAGFPTRQKVEHDLQADYRTALVYGESDIAQDQAEAENIRQAQERERQEAYMQGRILQEQYDHQRRMNQLEQTEKEIRIDAMFRAEADHARQQLGEIASPFAEVFQALRSQISKDAAEILESIQKNGFVRGKVAERGRGLLDLFDLMAVQNDHELRNRLVMLRSAIGPIGDERTEEQPARDVNQVKSILENILELERKAVDDLLSGPSRFSFIE